MIRLPRDTIAWRFGITIAAAMIVTCVLIGLFYAFGGVWARPPIDAAARLEGAAAIVHIVEASPKEIRHKLAESVNTQTYRAQWYAQDAIVSRWFERRGYDSLSSQSKEIKQFSEKLLHRKAFTITPVDSIYFSPDFPFPAKQYPQAYYFGVQLRDRSWLVFIGYGRYWGLSQSQRLGIWLAFLILAVVGVSAITTRLISKPIKQFAKAVRWAGMSPKAPPIQKMGPQELRDVIAAFNEMQEKFQEFIVDRTAMLAAISHDLRTPLTRMRLRGEYIEDRQQRDHLFRDVYEMQTMIDGALAFFRGDSDAEVVRAFDLAGMLQSIADDFTDQNVDVGYAGPNRLVYSGRPIALKRAITNLIENAIKYATPPQIALSVANETILIAVKDNGPGIPIAELDRVFQPFYRLDKSRNRASGGVGLGLTAAQAVIRGHGGTLCLRNRTEGGLEAIVTLPRFVSGFGQL